MLTVWPFVEQVLALAPSPAVLGVGLPQGELLERLQGACAARGLAWTETRSDTESDAPGVVVVDCGCDDAAAIRALVLTVSVARAVAPIVLVRGAAAGNARHAAVEAELARHPEWRLLVVPAGDGLVAAYAPSRVAAATAHALERMEQGLAALAPLIAHLDGQRGEASRQVKGLARNAAAARVLDQMRREVHWTARQLPSLGIRRRLLRPQVDRLEALHAHLPASGSLFLDMFDTLVRRVVDPPERVIELAVAEAVLVLARAGIVADADALLTLYMQVNHALRDTASRRGEDYECTIDEIWRDVARHLCGGEPEPELVAELVRTEVGVERSVLRAMPGAWELLVEAKARGLTVCVLSDVYYSSEQLRELLADVGLLPFIDAVYSSGELRRSKYSGRLFRHVLKHGGHDTRGLLHAGDNPFSDFGTPRALGIATVLYRNPEENARRHRLRREDRIHTARGLGQHLAALRAETPPPPPRWEGVDRELFDIGFWRIGPAVYSFLSEMLRWCRVNAVGDLFFLARDGYVLKEICDRLIARAGLPIRTHYLYVSRRSATCVPPDTLASGGYGLAVYAKEKATLRDVPRLCGAVEAPDPGAFGLAWSDEVRHVDMRPGFRDWLRAVAADPGVNAAFGERKALLAGYLESEGFFAPGGLKAIVDIGWEGSIQRSLCELFKDRADFPKLTGLYFGRTGVRSLLADLQDGMRSGFVIDSRPFGRRVPPLAAHVSVLELATGAPHGTTTGYRRGAGGVVPVLETADPRELRAGAMREGVRDFALWYDAAKRYAPNEAAFRVGATAEIQRFFKWPSRREAAAVGALCFDLGEEGSRAMNIVYSDLTFVGFLKRWCSMTLHPNAWREAAVAYRGIPTWIDHTLKWTMKHVRQLSRTVRHAASPFTGLLARAGRRELEPRGARSLALAALVVTLVATATRLAPVVDDGDWLLHRHPTEDGYLMLTVARNIALGKGMSVSDGVIATNGVQPLQTYLYAGVAALVDGDKIDLVRGALVLQTLIGLAAAWVMWRLGRHLFGATPLGRAAAALTAALWYAAPRNITHSMNCLESGLLCLCVGASLLYYLRRRPAADAALGPWASAWLGVLLGVTFLARNDAVFFIAALGLAHLATGVRSAWGKRTLDGAVFGAVAGLVGAPWMLYNLRGFGSIVPISGRAEMLDATLAENLPYLPLGLLHQLWIAVPLPQHFADAARLWIHGSPLAALACVATIGVLAVAWRRLSPVARTFAAIGVAYGALLCAWYGIFFGAHWFLPRFLFALTLFTAPAWGWGVCRLAQWASGALRLPGALAPRCAALAVVAVLTAAAVERHHGPDVTPFNSYRWAADNVSSGTWVAAIQSGFLGYFHDRTVNLDGKVNPHALAARQQGRLLDYVRDSDVHFIADWPEAIGQIEPVVSPAFELAAFEPYPLRGVLVLQRKEPSRVSSR